MDSFKEAWALITDYCQSHISAVAYTTFFSKLEPISMDFANSVATIEAPTAFQKQTIEGCYMDKLDEAFKNVFGDNIKINIRIHDDVVKEEEEKQKSASEYYALTFDTFIVGPSNNFAAAACQAVSSNPGNVYNPLFIYGNPGLGKTHLLNAIRTEIHATRPELNIVYVKSEQFTNELIQSISKVTTEAFREKYRKADVLLMDDIQFIGGKESTQEEFFHTFNTLYESKRQIILTSDRPPKEIATLEDRLRNRFEWGLMADIQSPTFETRVAIIKRKAELLDIDIPDTVSEFIANKLKTNIRQLEGVVKKLKAYYLLEGKKPSITMAQSAISDIISNDQPTPVTVDKIIEEVARNYGISADDIISPKRDAKISLARQIAIYVVREITQMPMKSIGESMGNRDHSTIVYAIQQVEKKLKTDPSVKANVDDIIKNIQNR